MQDQPARHMPDGYRTQSEDTSYEAECVYFDRLRKMTIEEPFLLTAQAIETGRVRALAGLRARFPGASERELNCGWRRSRSIVRR